MNEPVRFKWYYWVLIALLVKSVMFYLLTAELGSDGDHFIGASSTWEKLSGDADSYLVPGENLLSKGEYDPDYRMPGYSLFYFLLRLFLDPHLAWNFMVVVQSVMSAVSVYFLAKTAYLLFRSERMFYLVFFSYLFSTYTQISDLYILTESFTVSATIFSLFFLIRGIKNDSNGDYFLSGLWITWVIFMRPVYAPYLLIFALMIIFFRKVRRFNFSLVKNLFFLSVAFIVADGFWIIRNYKKYSTVIPLTKSMLYPDRPDSHFISMMKFFQSWGGSYIFWDPSAEIRLLGVEGTEFGMTLKTSQDVNFPKSIYTSQFNEDSMKLIRSIEIAIVQNTIQADSIVIVNDMLKEKFSRYTESVKQEHPLTYHVTSRLKYFKLFLLHSGTYNLLSKPWRELGIGRKVIKIFYSAEYLYVLLAGIIGSILLLINQRKKPAVLISVLTLYSILLFPFVLKLPEMRYSIPAFPFMLIAAMYVTNEILNRLVPIPNQSTDEKA